MLRIITEAELREAMRDNEAALKDRELALNELAELRDWFGWPKAKREWAGDPAYPLELIEMIQNAVEASWPVPITKSDLTAT